MSALGLKLRAGRADDARQLFAWRNLPELVALSTNQKTVTWPEHSAWYASALANPGQRIFIIEVEGQGVGMVRFTHHAASTGDWVISVYVIPGWTGRGLGALAIAQGSELVLGDENARRVLAYVRADNAPSIRAFHKAGFLENTPPEQDVAGHVEMIRRK